VPLSDEGKAFCVIYAILGIPITLLFLSAVVQRLMVVVTRRPISYLHRRWGMPRARLAALHAACLAALTVIFLLFVPAGIFVAVEQNWSFLESLYFCFISLSTIGLGDYVPGENHKDAHGQLYRLAITGEHRGGWGGVEWRWWWWWWRRRRDTWFLSGGERLSRRELSLTRLIRGFIHGLRD